MFKHRLKLARTRAGLTMAQLASSMIPPISKQSIKLYESGQVTPSLSAVVRIGQVLDVSLDFLLGRRTASLDCILWRNHSDVPAEDIARAKSLVTDRIESYLTIESILALPMMSDPFYEMQIDHVPEDDALIDEQARKLRMSWNLGEGPIPSMVRLLEKRGLIIVETDLSEQINGLTCQAQRIEGPPVEGVVVSSHTSVERKRYYLAQELAHRIIAPGSSDSQCVKEARSYFASAFLVPRSHLLGETGKDRTGMTVREVLMLKRTYGIPAAMMLKRLGQAGVLSTAAIEYAFRNVVRVWRRKEPEPFGPNEGFASLEKTSRYELLVWRALGERLISPSQTAELLGLSLNEIERDVRRIRAP